jgi:hypothetical protein
MKIANIMEVAPSAEEIIAKRADMQIANLKRNPSAIPSWFANIAAWNPFEPKRVKFVWKLNKDKNIQIYLIPNMQAAAIEYPAGQMNSQNLLRFLHKVFDLPPNTLNDLSQFSWMVYQSEQLGDIIRTALGPTLINAMLSSPDMHKKYSQQIKQLAAEPLTEAQPTRSNIIFNRARNWLMQHPHDKPHPILSFITDDALANTLQLHFEIQVSDYDIIEITGEITRDTLRCTVHHKDPMINWFKTVERDKNLLTQLLQVPENSPEFALDKLIHQGWRVGQRINYSWRLRKLPENLTQWVPLLMELQHAKNISLENYNFEQIQKQIRNRARQQAAEIPGYLDRFQQTLNESINETTPSLDHINTMRRRNKCNQVQQGIIPLAHCFNYLEPNQQDRTRRFHVGRDWHYPGWHAAFLIIWQSGSQLEIAVWMDDNRNPPDDQMLTLLCNHILNETHTAAEYRFYPGAKPTTTNNRIRYAFHSVFMLAQMNKQIKPVHDVFWSPDWVCLRDKADK